AVEVSRRIKRRPGVIYSALVPNRQGLDSALAAGMTEIAVFMSASETHNKKNINKTIAATLEAFRDTVPPARAAGLKVRAYLSTVYGCPYEGAVDPVRVVELCRQLRELGCYQLSLGDTIGVANPRQVRDVLSRVLAEIPLPEVAVHFHDTRGTALANILVSVEMGITTVDSALGGLGGCPYAPGASGNVATEDVIYMLEGMRGSHGSGSGQAGGGVPARLDAGGARGPFEVLSRLHGCPRPCRRRRRRVSRRSPQRWGGGDHHKGAEIRLS
ncbi:MAG: hydroxymethylglutaryl-CoA lyase, partial [Myxococcales bacterium]